jgi:ankyrin repeat protein
MTPTGNARARNEDEDVDAMSDAVQPDEVDPEVVELAGRVFAAARAGDAAALAAYLGAGVPADLCNERGDTLVMLAAYHGHADAVRALLERGADPDRANDRGQTPLAGAVFKGEPAVVDALLDGGANPHAGRPSAADTAQMFGRTELIERFGPR